MGRFIYQWIADVSFKIGGTLSRLLQCNTCNNDEILKQTAELKWIVGGDLTCLSNICLKTLKCGDGKEERGVAKKGSFLIKFVMHHGKRKNH